MWHPPNAVFWGKTSTKMFGYDFSLIKRVSLNWDKVLSCKHGNKVEMVLAERESILKRGSNWHRSQEGFRTQLKQWPGMGSLTARTTVRTPTSPVRTLVPLSTAQGHGPIATAAHRPWTWPPGPAQLPEETPHCPWLLGATDSRLVKINWLITESSVNDWLKALAKPPTWGIQW